jgi:SAM-dependent methyltransferase
MTALAAKLEPTIKPSAPGHAPVDPTAFVDTDHPLSWSRQMNALAQAGHYREAYALILEKCPYVENQLRYVAQAIAGEQNQWSLLHARLAQLLDDGRPQRILDVGCSVGGHAIQFAREGHQTWGIDLLPDMVRRGREFADTLGLSERVHLLEGDIRLLDAHFEPAFFDAAVACDIFEHLTDVDLAEVLRSLKQVVRPGGKIVIQTSPGRYYYWFEPHRKRLLALLAPLAWLPDRLFSAYVRGLDRLVMQAARHEPPSFYAHEPGHINCMDPIHLHALLAQAGFEQIRTFGTHAHPGFKDEGCLRAPWTHGLFGRKSIASRNVFGVAVVPAPRSEGRS